MNKRIVRKRGRTGSRESGTTKVARPGRQYQPKKQDRGFRDRRCYSFKAQLLLVSWAILVTIAVGYLFWIQYRSWLAAIISGLAAFIWHARMSAAELFFEFWALVLRVSGRKG